MKSVYGFQLRSIFLQISQYFINAKAEKSLVRCSVTLVLNAASLTSDWFYIQTIPALRNAFCFEQCQPRTGTVSVRTWSLSAQQATCWHHLNCGPQVYAVFSQETSTLPRSMKKHFHMDFLNTKSSTVVMQNTYFAPILIPILYHFYTALRDNSVPLSGTLDILWGYQDLSFSVTLRRPVSWG